MSYAALLTKKHTKAGMVYGVRYTKSKRVVWCKDYWEAAKRLQAANQPTKEENDGR
jgi:hypothetical protein